MLGLDGFPFHLIVPILRSNAMKNFAKILKESFVGSNICIPPYTPPSWVSIMTGTRAEKHKVLSVFKYGYGKNELTKKLITKADIEYPTLGEILAIYGMRGVVINQPFSYPPYAWYPLKNLIIVHDDFSPKEFIYPPDYARYLKYFSQFRGEYKTGDERILKDYVKYLEVQIEGLFELEQEANPDFVVFITRFPDIIFHRLPYLSMGRFTHNFLQILNLLDELINEFSKKYEVLAIVSDHGFSIHLKRLNFINMLRRCGLYKQKPELHHKILTSLLRMHLAGLLLYASLLDKRIIRLHYFLRQNILRRVSRHDSLSNPPRVGKTNFIWFDEIDADDSYVIFTTTTLVQEVCVCLNAGKDSTSFDLKPIRLSDEVYAILIEMYDSLVHPLFDARILADKSYFVAARHSIDGIFILRGPNINSCVGCLRNYDVLPSVLVSLGLGLPHHIDGTPIQAKYCSYIRESNIYHEWKIGFKLNLLKYSLRDRLSS